MGRGYHVSNVSWHYFRLETLVFANLSSSRPHVADRWRANDSEDDDNGLTGDGKNQRGLNDPGLATVGKEVPVGAISR